MGGGGPFCIACGGRVARKGDMCARAGCPGRKKECGHLNRTQPGSNDQHAQSLALKNHAKWGPIHNAIYNPINNPINNPIYSPISRARQVEAKDAEAEQHFQALKGKHGASEWPFCCYKSGAERIELWDRILRDKTLFLGHEDPRLRGKSIEDLLKDPNFCAYFGTTLRMIIEEWLRWLTKRGSMPKGGNDALDVMLAEAPKDAMPKANNAFDVIPAPAKNAKGAPRAKTSAFDVLMAASKNAKNAVDVMMAAPKNAKKLPIMRAKTKNIKGDAAYGKNRPVLMKPNGRCIGFPFAEKKLGFKVAEICVDGLLYNVTSLERMAQRSLDASSEALGESHFPRSLHRVAGAGSDGRYQDLDAIQAKVLAGKAPPMAKLFMTYSFELKQHLARGLVVLNE